MALVLSRKLNESIVIDGPCTISVAEIGHGKIRLAIMADRDVKILRAELLARGATITDGMTEKVAAFKPR